MVAEGVFTDAHEATLFSRFIQSTGDIQLGLSVEKVHEHLKDSKFNEYRKNIKLTPRMEYGSARTTLTYTLGTQTFKYNRFPWDGYFEELSGTYISEIIIGAGK